MPKRRRDPELSERRISTILDSVQPRFRRSFLLMLERIRGNLGPDGLAKLAAEGMGGKAAEQYERAAELFAREATKVYLMGAEEAEAFVRTALDVVIGFDQFSERAVAFVRENEFRMIREFVDDQRATVRRVVQDGIARGVNPIEQAREIRDSIGLTERQERSVANYRRTLEQSSSSALERELRDRRFDPSVRRAIDSGTPLTAAQIDRMVDRYRERKLKARAETIARTESIRALNAGMDEAFTQILGRANVPNEAVVRYWNDSGDDGRTRPAHLNMQVREVPVGEPFIDGNGVPVRFPGDPDAPPETTTNCRCRLSVRILLSKLPSGAEEAVAAVDAEA